MSDMKENIIEQVYSKHKLKRLIQMVLGVLLVAVSFNVFILPNNIVFGGVSGLSIIVTRFINISPSLFVLFSSIICLLFSFLLLPFEKTVKSILGTFLLPLFIQLTASVPNMLSLDTSDQLLLAIFGGVLYGLGAGLVFKAGYTTGGTDILNQIVSKYAKMSMGNAMLVVDGLIVLFGAFIFGWTKFMYAILILYIISFLTDKVLLGISDSKAFYIITTKQKEISKFVIQEMGHSVTVFDAKGGFSKEKNPVLFTVIPTKEYYKFKEGIHLIDPNAFFTVIDAYEVRGGA